MGKKITKYNAMAELAATSRLIMYTNILQQNYGGSMPKMKTKGGKVVVDAEACTPTEKHALFSLAEVSGLCPKWSGPPVPTG